MMKKIKWMMAAIIMIAGMGLKAQVTNKDEMVRKIFTVFHDKDEASFLQLFPDAVIMKEYLKKMFAGAKEGTDEDVAMMNSFLEKISDSSLQREFRKDFKEFVRKGEDNGVEWAGTRLVSFTADSSMSEEDGVKMGKLSGKIYFNVGEKEFFLAYNEVIWFENKGWYGVSVERVDEKANEDKGENPWEMYTDSTMALDSVATAVEPPPPPKPKTPVKKQPVKNKTQSPAKKPE